MKIKVHCHKTISKRDLYGNVYFVIKLTNNETGDSFTYYDSCDNSAFYLREAGYNWGDFNYTEEIIPIRQFNKLAKNHKYMFTEEIVSKLASWINS